MLTSLLHGNALLALAAAITWGGGDFAGGMGVKRAGGSLSAALRVTFLSHGTSLVALLLLIALRGDPIPHGTPLLWGLAAGLFGGASVLCFYLCLARGVMGVPAAVSGLLAAAIPSLVSGLLEGAPRATHLAGFLLAAVAIWLIAAGPAASTIPAGTLPLSVAAGAGFGLYFVALRMAGPGGLLWSLALSRSLSISVCLAGLGWLLLTRGSSASHPTAAPAPAVRLDRVAVQWALGTALLDTAGNLFYIAATRAGRLDVAAVLASLYPATTILLAAWLLRERPGRLQALGMSLAVVAVVLITL